MKCPDCKREIKFEVERHERPSLFFEEGETVAWINLTAKCICGYSAFAEVDVMDFHEEHGEGD